MGSHMINLFLCILSSLYLCFGLLYFCCRILPSKHKISLPLFLCLSVFMALLFWIKRESQHNGITIVFQLTTFLVTLFLFQASFMKKLAVYFIFQLLIICPEILCTSVFIALHNLFIPTDTYTPHNLISSCSPAEYRTLQHPAWPVSSLENIRNPAAVYRLFENTHLFTTVTATDRSGFSQCYNFPSEKARSSSGSEHHLLDHMHRQLSVVSACSSTENIYRKKWKLS